MPDAMRIAILNECFFEEKHIDCLKQVGEVFVYANTTTEDEVIERLKESDIGIIDMFVAPITRNVLDHCKHLKLLALNSTGFDHVDHAYARELGINVSNVPNFSTDSVAEQVIALMFAVNRKIVCGDIEYRKSLIEIDPGNEDHKKFLGFNIKGKTMGVVGAGNIGSGVIKRAHGLGMNVLFYNRSKKNIPEATFVEMDYLLKNSDVVAVTLSFNKDTTNFIDTKEFDLMQAHTILINIARDKIVNTDALFYALKNNKIGGAGLDVPHYGKDDPVLALDNVVFSPHLGWYTQESLRNIAEILVETVEHFSKEKPINIIN